ncbi:hypothetical protein [Dyella psychrodurans]|uniref:Uncharacterized protein n=1 Tax=Dyella psychrodurans TaxID=1927960 RepID=A0A370WYD0_9GAMM|nr:hypothetical protein [Dyella psychrodurans]RDS81011.1 hypothetical protein DWU99_18335 [Dyella psychrodurans]
MISTDDELIALSSATDEQLSYVRALKDADIEQLERLVDEERRWADRAFKMRSPAAEALQREVDDLQYTLTLARVARDRGRLERVLSGAWPSAERDKCL